MKMIFQFVFFQHLMEHTSRQTAVVSITQQDVQSFMLVQKAVLTSLMVDSQQMRIGMAHTTPWTFGRVNTQILVLPESMFMAVHLSNSILQITAMMVAIRQKSLKHMHTLLKSKMKSTAQFIQSKNTMEITKTIHGASHIVQFAVFVLAIDSTLSMVTKFTCMMILTDILRQETVLSLLSKRLRVKMTCSMSMRIIQKAILFMWMKQLEQCFQRIRHQMQCGMFMAILLNMTTIICTLKVSDSNMKYCVKQDFISCHTAKTTTQFLLMSMQPAQQAVELHLPANVAD